MTAPTTEELSQAALRVAVLGVAEDDSKNAYAAARKAAEPLFAAARAKGVKQVAVMLPGGVEAGVLAIKAGGKSIEVDEDALLLLISPAVPSETEDYVTAEAGTDPRTVALLAEHCPDLVELKAKPGALHDERAVKVLAEHAPDLVNLRIKPAFRAEMQKYIDKHDGMVPHPVTSELVSVGTVTAHGPTGDFSWTGKKASLGKVRDALAAGRLVITETGDVVAPIAGETVPPAAIESGVA
jgi:hypothetical protein